MRYLLSVLWIALVDVQAQVTTGSVSGYVLDSRQSAISGATVRITESGHSAVRETHAGADGFYRFVDLAPDVYDLVASAPGFETVARKSVAVSVDSRLRVDMSLQVAGRKDAIAVAAVVSSVQSESSELGVVINRSQIHDLPLNRRDFLQLALLTPGVLTPVQDSELSTRGSFAMHANGAREEFNNFLLDGVDNNDQDVNRYVLQPPVDAIQEFKILTNSYSAEYGRSAGAQVNVITRSGTDEYHGFVYEYLRNRHLDARNFFDNATKSEYIRNQYGSGVGGPILRDRAFFFGAFEGLRGNQGLPRLGTVPGLAQRQGDFSDSDSPVMDPYSQAPFPGNHIPLSRIAPLALRVLDLFPSPNLTAVAGNYFSSPVLRDRDMELNGRVDLRPSNSDRLALRYTYGKKNITEPFAENSTNLPGFGDLLYDRGHNAMVQDVHTFNEHLINSISLGLNHATRRLLPENYRVDVNRAWGVSYLPTNPLEFGYPGINVGGYSYIGDVTSLPIDRTETTYQLSDAVSWLQGKHALRFGEEFRKLRLNGVVDVLSRGTIPFSGALTGDGLADLLLGLPTFVIQSQADNQQTQRTASSGVFFQDDWKVRSNLTVNAGLRYEYNSPVTDPTNRMAVFDLRTGTLNRVGINGSSRSGYKADLNNLAPRLGLAWEVSPGFVIRTAYGVFYDAGITVVNSSLYFNPPFFNIRAFFPTETSVLTLNDPFPTTSGFAPPPSLSTLSPDIRTAYLQHWNLNLQREVKSIGTLSVAYAGSKGTHLLRSLDLNQPSPGPGDISSRAPYPLFSNIFFTESGSNSDFQSFQASLTRTLSRNLSFLAAYTFSKSIDDTTAFLSTKADKNFPQDSHDFRAERALSSFDTRSRFVAAYSYCIPGSRWWNRNSEASGIVTLQAGQPFTPVLRFDNSNTGNTGGSFGSDRPNLLRNPKAEHPSPEQWFDTTAFAVPPQYTFGNAGRNIVRGPGLASADVAISRLFYVAEKSMLTVEAQAFNLLNRTNFNLPELYADEPSTFGRIFSAKPPRQMQVALRLEF